MIAVIPCAGRGTRMGGLTALSAKELLPFGSGTVLDCVVEELARSGCRRIFVIIREGKECVREHILKERHGGVHPDLRFEFVYQPEPLGLGHAYLQLKGKIHEPFIAALPDHVVWGDVLDRMLREYADLTEAGHMPIILKSETVVLEDEQSFSTGKRPGDDLQLRNSGRLIYPPEFLGFISENDRDPITGEVTEREAEDAFLERFAGAIRSIRVDCEVWDMGTEAGYHHYIEKLERTRTGHDRPSLRERSL